LLFIFLLTVCVICLTAAGAPAQPGRSAYVMRFERAGVYLDRFDLTNDAVATRISLPRDAGYNNFVVDEAGGCYLAKYCYGNRYGREISYYDPQRNKIRSFIKFRDIFGPRYMILTRDELIVEVCGNDRTKMKSGLVFIDRRSGKITRELFIQENNPALLQANINDLFYDGSGQLLFTSFYIDRYYDDEAKNRTRHEDGYGDIYVVDVAKKEISKQIPVPREYTPVDGVCRVGDKIYVAALSKGSERDAGGSTPLNKELLVFSFSSGRLIKKIPVSPHPIKLVYDKSVGKLYVRHTSDYEPRDIIEVIDPRTDRIIDRIKIGSPLLMFALVKPGKLYVSAKQGLVVINTKTAKIIKQLPGNYAGISQGSFVE
jgi:DNA-binding beta-propeller fold protein YncE